MDISFKMKKIKYLLLGIVSLLGIGCSFGYAPYYIDYFTHNGGLTSYNLNSRVNNSFPFCVLGLNSLTYSTNLDDYFSWCNGATYNTNYNNYSVYFDDNGNKLSYFFPGATITYGQYSSTLVLSNNLASTQIGNTSNGAYSRILGNESCLGTGIFQTGNFCSSNFIELFTNNYYTISSLGNIYDSDYDGVHYYKGPVAPSVGLGYSFGFVDGSGWQNSGTHYYLNSGDIFHFRTITFSGSTIFPIDGPLIFRLNNTTNLSVGDSYKIIALGPTGDYQDFSFIYSIYNCSSSAIKIFDCSFLEGGDIAENFDYDFTLPSNYNYPYINLIYFLTKSSSFVKFNNSYSSTNNTLILSSRLGNSLSDDTITLNLVPSATGSDIIGIIPGVDDGNQSTGSIAINTGFLNLCLNNLEFGELNSYLCNKLLNGNNLVLIPGQIGYYLSYGYDENGNLRFWITYQETLEEQMSGYVREQDENGNWYTYLPEEFNTGVDSSNGLKDYFNNWFEHGVFFSCPFHYTDSYYREFKLFGVSHFVPKLGESFLFPIYCMGAGFREGKNIEFFSGVSLGLESQLLSSPDYNYLYRLFDLILSVSIMFFIIKIYHLLN